MTFNSDIDMMCYKSLSRMPDGAFDLMHQEFKALNSMK